MDKFTMYNYIATQHETLVDMLQHADAISKQFIDYLKGRNIKKVYLLGSGTSLHAAVAAKTWINTYFEAECDVMIPTQFTNYENVNVSRVYTNEEILCIGISQSGTSYSTINAIKKSNDLELLNCVITSNLNSPITEVTSLVIPLMAEPEKIHVEMRGYTATLLTLYMLCVEFAYKKGKITRQSLLNKYDRLRELIIKYPIIKSQTEAWYRNNEKELLAATKFCIAGYGYNYGTAMEATLKLHETFHRPSIGYEFEEFMHGPQLATTPESYIFFIAGPGVELNRVPLFTDYYKLKTEHVFIITNQELPTTEHDLVLDVGCDPEISGFLFVLPFQLLTALLCLGGNVDTSIYPMPKRGLGHSLSNMNKLKAVIFDMDGLLINSEQINIDCWKAIIDKENIELDIQIIIDTTGSSGREAEEYIKSKTNKDLCLDELRIEKDKLLIEYIEKNGVPLKKGVMELFDYLDKKNIKKILVTSTFEQRANYMLRRANIWDCFDLKIYGSNELKTKPHPDLYNKMILLSGLKRGECLVLEDSENGIKAANNAGLDVIGIPDIISISHLRLPHLLAVKNDLIGVITYIEEKLNI